MLKIKKLYHGTNKKFEVFDDFYLGTGLGIGYIKAHWFSVGDSSEKVATIYAKILDM